jgi:hypothetical protein
MYQINSTPAIISDPVTQNEKIMDCRHNIPARQAIDFRENCIKTLRYKSILAASRLCTAT